MILLVTADIFQTSVVARSIGFEDLCADAEYERK
jgi:hypothetical protein